MSFRYGGSASISMKVHNAGKIAVLRANGLGDFMFVLPALHALRAAYPEAEIVLLGLLWHREFLSPRPSPVDRVIPVPISKGIREEAGVEEDDCELDAFFASMRNEKFDIALQMHGGGRYSNPFVLALDARVTAGLKTPDAAPLDLSMPYIYFQPEVLRYLEVVGLVGATPVTLEPAVSVIEDDIQESLSVLTATDRPLVAFAPGAGDGRRRWPAEKFAVVADRLAEKGARVVVPGVSAEEAVIEAMLRNMKSPAENLCNRLSMGGLAGLLSRCSLVVGNDSGPLHLAKAVGTATVGVYWCGNLITAEPMTRSRHRPLLSWNLECPVCGTNYGFESSLLDVSRYELRVSGLARPLRIAGLSDLHLPSLYVSPSELVEAVNREEPDVVLIVGDTVDGAGGEHYLSILSQIRAAMCKLAILGNREYMRNVDLLRFREGCREAGVDVLVNKSVDIAGLRLVGLDDFIYGAPDYGLLERSNANTCPTIVVSHCPAPFDEVKKVMEGDLIMISGHTHGGQIAPLGHALILPNGSGDYVKGWYGDEHRMMYVMRGVGTAVVPVRIGSRPEILVLSLMV